MIGSEKTRFVQDDLSNSPQIFSNSVPSSGYYFMPFAYFVTFLFIVSPIDEIANLVLANLKGVEP